MEKQGMRRDWRDKEDDQRRNAIGLKDWKRKRRDAEEGDEK